MARFKTLMLQIAHCVIIVSHQRCWKQWPVLNLPHMGLYYQVITALLIHVTTALSLKSLSFTMVLPNSQIAHLIEPRLIQQPMPNKNNKILQSQITTF